MHGTLRGDLECDAQSDYYRFAPDTLTSGTFAEMFI
jgi:hypothetical protein